MHQMMNSLQKQAKIYMNECVTKCIGLIKGGNMCQEEIIAIIGAIGESQQSVIKDEVDSYRKHFKSDDYLQNFDTSVVADNSNKVIATFLKSVCNLNDMSRKQKCAFVKCIALIYYLSNDCIVTPMHFVENLLTYFLTSSKVLCNIHNKF